MSGNWPDTFNGLVAELHGGRSRPALIIGAPAAVSSLIERLSPLVDEVVSIGQRVAHMDQAPSVRDLVDGLTAASTLLIEIDALFTPDLHVEVVPLLRRTSKGIALLVAWPGQLTGGRLSYSFPGRADYLDEPARDLILLRPVETQFPDEVPYLLERCPA